MGQIEIIYDPGKVYEEGTVLPVEELIEQYRETLPSMNVYDWLCRIPIPTAVDFIAEAWGISYRFV